MKKNQQSANSVDESIKQTFQQKSQLISSQKCSSLKDYYLYKITPSIINSLRFKNILQTLQENGFEYSKNYSFNFQKKIIKSSRDSVKYQIQYGNFRMNINAVFTEYVFEQNRQFIGQGKFGRVYLCQYQGQKIVAKELAFIKKSQQLNSVLIQIFWTKLVSILQIGPKFIKAYGYDIVFSQKTCEYLMEYCQNFLYPLESGKISDQQFQEKISTRLKNILQVMHSIHAINGDIKPEHFVWSQKKQNFMLLDFGMSIFVKQNIGFMTKTRYFGTFKYSSPQMKKSFVKNVLFFVDLYYNDLFAVEKSLEEIQKLLNKEQIEKINYIISDKCLEWELRASLIKFKFLLFEEQAQQALIFSKKNPELDKVYQQIINQEIKFNQSRLIPLQNLQSIRKLSAVNNFQKQLDKNSFTQTLFWDVVKSRGKNTIFYDDQTLQKRIKDMSENQQLQAFLQSNESMQTVFAFIYRIKQVCPQKQIEQKKQVIRYIFEAKFKQKCENYSFIYRSVLMMFQEYFFRQHNLEKLKIIESILQVTCEIRQLKKVQNNMSIIFLRNPSKWLKYYLIGLFNFSDFRKNIRLKWQWLITDQEKIKQYMPTKFQQLVNYCIYLVKELDRKLASDFIQFPNSLEQFRDSISFCFKKLGFKIEDFMNVMMNSGQIKNEENNFLKQIEPVIDRFRKEILTWQSFQQKEAISNYNLRKCILRETVWDLKIYYKNKQIQLFQKCIGQIVQNVFVEDTPEGVFMYVIFSSLLCEAAKNSNKTKQMIINFITRIKINEILEQIKDDIYSLKQLILNFSDLKTFTEDLQYDENQRETIISALDQHYNNINIFFHKNSKKYQENLQIKVVLTIMKCQNNANISLPQYLKNIVKILKNAFFNKSRPEDIFYIFKLIDQKVSDPSEIEDQIDQIYEIIQNYDFLFYILFMNIKIFKIIIHRLCSKQQYKQCFQLLARQEKLNKQIIGIKNNIQVFSQFVRQLPEHIIIELFVNRFKDYNFKKIAQSPQLAFILLFAYEWKSFLFNQMMKKKIIILISFGIHKFKVKVLYHELVIGSLLRLHRQQFSFKNSRSQRINIWKEARVSHNISLLAKVVAIKQKKCKKLQSKKIKCEIIGENLLKKINKINDNIKV